MAPDFTIKEWNTSNYDVHTCPFTERMYKEKKWAFVADYVRLDVLYKEGGIFLDTDMELVQDITPLLSCELLLGEEQFGTISAGMIGAVPHNIFIQACREKYTTVQGLPPTIPRLMTEVYTAMKSSLHNVSICPPVAFYPYSQETISAYKKSDLTPQTYGVHLWNYSWGPPLLRILNHYPLYHSMKRLLDSLGLKRILKKILKLS
jgi:hypothetical protein